MKSTEKRIEELEKELQALKDECGKGGESQGEWARKQSNKETKFSEGDWVVVTHPREDKYKDAIVKYTGLCDLTYGFNHAGKWTNGEFNIGYAIKLNDIKRKSTPKEIESALRKEWARRCKEAGWDDPDRAEIEGHADGATTQAYVKYSVFYSFYRDKLWSEEGLIYEKGKWATPKKKATKFFDWEVKESSKTIDIGCKTYSKEFLRELYDALYEVKEHSVMDVIDELRKLDL